MQELQNTSIERYFRIFISTLIVLYACLLIVYGFVNDEMKILIKNNLLFTTGVFFLISLSVSWKYEKFSSIVEKLIFRKIKSNYRKILIYGFIISIISVLLIIANLTGLYTPTFLKNRLEITMYALSIPIILLILLIIKEFIKMFETSVSSNEILKQINNNRDIYSKEMEKIKYHLSWLGNIYKIDEKDEDKKKLDILWVLLKNDYLTIEKNTIAKKNMITSLEYYPAIVESILKYYLITAQHPDTKIELVTTMLPEHFFNFPSYSRVNKKIFYKKQDFVDSYRTTLVTLIEKIKGKSPIDSFQRYTLVYNDLISSDSEVYNDDEIYTLSEIQESKKIYISEDFAPRICYEKNDLTYMECTEENLEGNFAYDLEYEEKEEIDRIDLMDFFQNSLHLSDETSYIVPLTQKKIFQLSKNYDYLLIKSNECDICIKANISLDNNSVLIEIIEGKELEEIKSIHKKVILQNENKLSLKDFLKTE